MAEKDDKKPSLAVVIAQSKKAPGGDAADADSDDEGYGGGASAECVSCVRQMFEAGADGDYEGAAQALQAAIGHARSPAEEDPEEEV